MPVDGFYEWRRDGRLRQPYLIRRRDGVPLALAGIWSGWHDPRTSTIVRTFSILTTRPNELVATLHDRMPVVLARQDWARWLDRNQGDEADLKALLVPSRADELELVAVGRLVNDVRNEGRELIAPAGDEQLTALR